MDIPLNTSQPTPILSEVLDKPKVIPLGALAYFRGRLSNRIHELALSEFVKLERAQETNKAELARRIGRAPEQITRWLGSPGNWTFDTLSDLLLGMGLEPDFSVRSLKDAPGEKPVEGVELANAPLALSAPGTSAANDETADKSRGPLGAPQVFAQQAASTA